VFGSTDEKGTATKIVDFASDAFGMVKDARDKGIAKNLSLTVGNAEMVLDIGGGFLEVEGRKVIANADALVEGFIGSKAEFVGEVGLTEQDEGERGSGIHIVVEQEAKLVKEFRRQQMSFVNDEKNETAFASEVG
jgi:hypothetical protein